MNSAHKFYGVVLFDVLYNSVTVTGYYFIIEQYWITSDFIMFSFNTDLKLYN